VPRVTFKGIFPEGPQNPLAGEASPTNTGETWTRTECAAAELPANKCAHSNESAGPAQACSKRSSLPPRSGRSGPSRICGVLHHSPRELHLVQLENGKALIQGRQFHVGLALQVLVQPPVADRFQQ